ncbi:MAG: DUF1599 domain-containing protein [Bacteroidales bacterium]|nr:DUF1599 domain-containing protein [Bacteroidales bacterium]
MQNDRTRLEVEREAACCRSLFEGKTRDYGTAWRVLRLPSLTDQILIKARRIRSVQESGENRVGDSLRGELVAIVNYAVMALVQGTLDDGEPMELPLDRAMELYDQQMAATLDLMMAKNHDYGEAWRQMRVGSMVDMMLMKLMRIKQIEDNGGRTEVSEGVEGGYRDIVNYALFCLVRTADDGKEAAV